MKTRLLILIAAMLAVMAGQASAVPQNPQRIMAGFPFPVFVNNTGTNQTITQGAYVNQTQYTPAAPSTAKLLFKPTP